MKRFNVKLTLYYFILFFVNLSISLHAQLKTFEITELHQQISIPIFTNYPDYSALILYSSIENINFSSNTGGIVDEIISPVEGKITLITRPENQIITVKCNGFIEGKFKVTGLTPRAVRYYSIEEKGNADKKIPIVLNTNVDSPKYYIDDEYIGTSMVMHISPGSHLLRIKKEGYEPIVERIEVKENNIFFNFHLNQLDLQPVTIRTLPEGATAFVNNVDKGSTNLQFFQFPGTYSLRLTLDEYTDVIDTIEINKAGMNDFFYALSKNTASISFDVTPKEAFVKIDNQAISDTIANVVPGQHTIEIILSGYQPIKESINLKSLESVHKKYDLTKYSATLALNLTPPDARVLINKSDYTNSSKIELAPGIYKLEIRKEGYEAYDEILEIKQNESLRRNVDLKLEMGSLQITVKPISARVDLKVDNILKETWYGAKMINLPVGKYRLEISNNGYEEQIKDLVISKNSTTIESIELQSIQSHSADLSNQNEELKTSYTKDFSRFSAFLQSVLIPGLGQITNENGRGWIYITAAAGAGMFYYLSIKDHNKKIDDYNSMRNIYYSLPTNENLNAAQLAYAESDKSKQKVFIALAALALVYTVNIIDALSFDPLFTNKTDVTRINPTINFYSGKYLVYGLNVRLPL
ncbi:MAG: PEGA domain-containing protein [Melioribacteraceae bacterium]|nr:PEGA domain-containing protein [Melioribacteraceae bacterium]